MKKPQLPYILTRSSNNRHGTLTEKPWLVPLIIAATFTVVLLTTTKFLFNKRSLTNHFLCSLSSAYVTPEITEYTTTPTQLLAILHYATSRTVPQQSYDEIRLSFDVLQSIAPCNFLVFGLGHDSLMWASLNPGGTTLFLEEDPKWLHKIIQRVPTLRAHLVKYPTKLSEANKLLSTYKKEEDCMPPNARLEGNKQCKLALSTLPEEVYKKEWDVIMIDAPKGYFAEAPGRMGAIYTAAVMSRGRTRAGVTHVFLHDVDRKVEKAFANEFLCKKYLVKGAGRLWHFAIPPAPAASRFVENNSSFC
ncbi:hypothetical protein K2173_014099 [Erythroxylum novogranatense]|uniref:Polysaccharide biosynthesis domain-containing protein n=1 Tax=Erythroxylum novogranatense TaxID=1862640 RepID=A0AAV8SDR7_9ROSI|nr:hypothetical protein K2173_014099 [Erythroxylum novogranatense]